MGQMPRPSVLSHVDQMYKLAETERHSGNGPAIVFVYDELLRRSLASRAEWGDPSLDVAAAVGETDKQILEAARPRLHQAGMLRQAPGAGMPSGSAALPT